MVPRKCPTCGVKFLAANFEVAHCNPPEPEDNGADAVIIGPGGIPPAEFAEPEVATVAEKPAEPQRRPRSKPSEAKDGASA